MLLPFPFPTLTTLSIVPISPQLLLRHNPPPPLFYPTTPLLQPHKTHSTPPVLAPPTPYHSSSLLPHPTPNTPPALPHSISTTPPTPILPYVPHHSLLFYPPLLLCASSTPLFLPFSHNTPPFPSHHSPSSTQPFLLSYPQLMSIHNSFPPTLPLLIFTTLLFLYFYPTSPTPAP
jgi:hypothetical protein